MHKQARHQWQATSARTCHGCAAKGTAEERHSDPKRATHGVYFGARPTEGMWHAMSDPVLSYEDDDTRWVTGASGTVYPPRIPPDADE